MPVMGDIPAVRLFKTFLGAGALFLGVPVPLKRIRILMLPLDKSAALEPKHRVDKVLPWNS